MGYSPWVHKELDTTEKLHFHFHQHERLPRWHSGKVSTCQDEMQKTQFRSLSWEDPLEGTLVQKIPWTEKSSGLQSMRSQRVRHN